ncbi:MAG: histidinol-phosphate aminotransferase family protein, partial [Chloroflexi bacterium]|nr:histidinol-phosphate aminotransferase family protein [Chloroflexota bacterium]
LLKHAPFIRRLGQGTGWQLPVAFEIESVCAHGGAFFEAIGTSFETLERGCEVVNADVLDAWFPPAPGALAAVGEHLPWLLRTSPPAHAAGLITTIAKVRGISEDSLVVGAGSSALIYLALRHWLSSSSRVLLPDPIYGEYAHLLEKVIGSRVDRIECCRATGFQLDLDAVRSRLLDAAERQDPYHLLVLVNPNNPTGSVLRQPDLESLAADLPEPTRLWVDEAYVDYLGAGNSLEAFAADSARLASANVVVCKSLSKGLALSGARVAYLCGPPVLAQDLRQISPPWAVGLPAQVAAAWALRDPTYYARRYAETSLLREELVNGLCRAFPRMDVCVGPANWVLCFLPHSGPSAGEVVARCSAQGVFLRDASTISPRLGTHAIRIAVKDSNGNDRILAALQSVLPGA